MAMRTWRTYRFVLPAIAIVLALPLVPDSATARNGGIAPLTTSLLAARSGQTYFWRLQAEGGKKPYHCTYLNLHLGTLALNTSCEITGRAPVVNSESITGPFIFKLHDSSQPPKTIEFSPMNFTTVTSQKTPPTSTTTSPPTPDSYDGTWTGTFTFVMNTPASAQLGYPADSAQITMQIHVYVFNEVVTKAGGNDNGNTTNDSAFTFAGAGTDQPPVSAGGLVTFPGWSGQSYDPANYDDGFFGEAGQPLCTGASIQFTGATAQNTSTLSCQGMDVADQPASLTNGEIRLTLSNG